MSAVNPEAFADGTLQVGEVSHGGSVPNLLVVNGGDKPVLIVDGALGQSTGDDGRPEEAARLRPCRPLLRPLTGVRCDQAVGGELRILLDVPRVEWCHVPWGEEHMTVPELSRLERVDLRKAWVSEPADFTPWLAREENLAFLGEALGMSLVLEATEKSVGPFAADILCREPQTEQWVLIENQLEQTDHTHLGQIITYAAGLNAVTVIWVAATFVEEHRAALDWLNEVTAEGTNFFGVDVELWRIGDSAVAPKFNIASKPNAWSKRVTKSAESGPQWNEETFFAALTQKSPDGAAVAREILEWAKENMPDIYWGTGKRYGSFTPGFYAGTRWQQVVGVWTNGYVELQLDYMRQKPPFDDEVRRQELADRFAAIPGFNLPDDAIRRRPSVELKHLYDSSARKQFFTVLEWAVQEMKLGKGDEYQSAPSPSSPRSGSIDNV